MAAALGLATLIVIRLSIRFYPSVTVHHPRETFSEG